MYHLRDTHFNARGNAIAGRGLARLIEAKLTGSELPDYAMPAERAMEASAPEAVAQSPGSAPAESQSTAPTDEATEILRQFGARISAAGVDGTRVLDDSQLNRPKEDIKSAIIVVLNGEVAADQKAFAREAAPVLAFFQPGVGEGGVALDTLRSDQQTWRSVVEAEMQLINRDIALRNQGE